jgi:hypothetical protein
MGEAGDDVPGVAVSGDDVLQVERVIPNGVGH